MIGFAFLLQPPQLPSLQPPASSPEPPEGKEPETDRKAAFADLFTLALAGGLQPLLSHLLLDRRPETGAQRLQGEGGVGEKRPMPAALPSPLPVPAADPSEAQGPEGPPGATAAPPVHPIPPRVQGFSPALEADGPGTSEDDAPRKALAPLLRPESVPEAKAVEEALAIEHQRCDQGQRIQDLNPRAPVEGTASQPFAGHPRPDAGSRPRDRSLETQEATLLGVEPRTFSLDPAAPGALKGLDAPQEPLSPTDISTGPTLPDLRPEGQGKGLKAKASPRETLWVSDLPSPPSRPNPEGLPESSGGPSGSGPAIPPQALHRIVAAVQRSLRAGGVAVQLELQPKTLGRVRVQVTLEDGLVKAQVQVEVPSTKAALEASLPSLEQALLRQGLSIGRFEVAVGPDVFAGGGRGRSSRSEAWGFSRKDLGREARDQTLPPLFSLQSPTSGLPSLVDVTI